MFCGIRLWAFNRTNCTSSAHGHNPFHVWGDYILKVTIISPKVNWRSDTIKSNTPRFQCILVKTLIFSTNFDLIEAIYNNVTRFNGNKIWISWNTNSNVISNNIKMFIFVFSKTPATFTCKLSWNKMSPEWISSHRWITTWWRHQMELFSALLAICAGNSSVPQRPVTRSFDVFFDLRLNKRLSKQS